MKKPDGYPIRSLRKRAHGFGLLLAALALVSQAGCGREFFREWANQDVSEAIFEKSRDPRWRIEQFTVEPPALARFANPYDPDRPPAPPDDRATEALSPVPQWPDNRLLVPAEGTGYLDMLEAWQRQRPPKTKKPAANDARARRPAAPPTPPAEGTNSPFSSKPNTEDAKSGDSSDNTDASTPAPPKPDTPEDGSKTGTGEGPLTPIPGRESRSFMPVDGNAPSTTSVAPRSTQDPARTKDLGVTLTAFQQTGLPLPQPTPSVGESSPATTPSAVPAAGGGMPGGGAGAAGSDEIIGPPVDSGMRTNAVEPSLTERENPRPDQTPEQYRAGEAMASELAGVLVPGAIDFNEAEAAGQPVNSNPYQLSMDQAFTLALINSRIYQFQIEQLYVAALSVTLQRFSFTPQMYAGMSPLTSVVGRSFLSNPSNTFNYSTRETGTPASTLNLGAAAGVGKLFSTGGSILAGFANQVVFNFIGKNSIQPQVRSFLPIAIFQPFLRGGGRAVTLEPLTQAERSLLYTIRTFAKFRQEFTVQTLIGGTVTVFGSTVQGVGFSGAQSTDPNIGYLNVVEDVLLLENQRRNIAAYTRILEVYTELAQGESSGISRLQVDQIDQQLQNAKTQFYSSRTQYRSDLDQYKQQIGLPPDTPIMIDRSMMQRFRDVFTSIDEWQKDPRRNLDDLPRFAKQLPDLPDIVLDGRSVQGVYKKPEGQESEDDLEPLLLVAERIAMEHRLDLMNQRATLYDIWRQIKVNANALMGVFNVALTNQFVTPPTTTNPFGFIEQAKNFSLVFNAELPLVRVSERNQFRQSLIAYERQRRSLQSTEDTIKNVIRQEIRQVQTLYLNYEIARRNLVLAVRLKDQAFEQIIAPPAGVGTNQAALQTTNLTQFQGSLINIQNQLVQTWYQYQIQRLQLYRDIGILPIDEWEAFHELFPQESYGSHATAPAAGGTGPAGAAAAGGAQPEEAVGGGR